MPRGEILEQKTEAYIGEVWYTIARNQMTYNSEGKRTSLENLAGQVTTTAWDCCHKVSEVQPDGSTTTWDYDDEGRVIASSRLIPLDMTNITWLTTCYEYDAIGRQTGYIVGGQTVSYAYDPVTGRLISAASGTNEFFYTYLPGTDLVAGYVSGDFSHTVSYESSRDLVSAITNRFGSRVVSAFGYSNDAAGRRTAISRSGEAFGDLSGATDAYGYNERSEVVSARRTKGGASVRGFDEDFSYDPIGNRVSTTNYDETGSAIVSEYTANSLNQYMSRTVPGVAAVRGFADANATVTVNENPAYRLGEYFFGSDEFDNSQSAVDAALVTTAALASPTNGPDEVASVMSRVHIAKSPQPFEYDDDGNQTLVTTKTGTWRVTYNGENRPVRWTRINAADTNAQTTILMSFDHQGRRRLYLETSAAGSTNRLDRFTYDNYLCVARNRWQPDGTSATDRFVWDPTEPIATRPLICDLFGVGALFYCHDGNKNVSEAVTLDGTIAAHYEYSSFGKVVLVTSENEDQSMANLNPYRFSSEYADDALGLVYYNYRHYEPVAGRWLSRDLMGEFGGQSLYSHVENRLEYDFLGLARMITFARRKWNAAYAGEDKAALKLMRLVENLNKMTKGGCPCFEIVFKDLVGATIESIQNDASSYDEVFIYSHGALRINGKIRTPSSYEWTGDDVVEELLCTDYKGSYLSVDALVKAGILIDNIFACYITKGHRKVGGGWFSNPVSTISQQAENITQLADRLRSIAQGLDNCEKKKKVVIYEGQRNSKNLWYGTERALQDPLPYEEE